MSCPKPVELSRALIVGIDDQLRAHLEICTQCSEDLEAHASIAADTRQLGVVEPSADHAWKVRASLMAAARAPALMPRSRIVWGFAAAGALAAAAVLAFVLLRPDSSPRGQVAQYRGTLLPHEGAALLRVASGPDEIVRLTHGTVSVQVAKLEPGERFRVVTGDAEVEVRGTAFDVTVDRDHLRSVRVLHGRVEVRAYGAAAKVLEAGERWELQLASAEPAPDLESVPGPGPDLEPQLEPEPEPDHIEIVDDAVSPPAPTTRSKHRKASRADVTKRVPHEELPRTPVAHVPAPQTPATQQTPTKQQITAKQPITVAPARPKRPIEVLFEEGWATLNAGNAAAAAGIFERAAQSAPKDPLAEDAWFWRASALSRAKSSSAAAALDAFLSRYPSSPRVGEASAMLGWLIMDRDLDRAEKLFHTAEKDRVAAVRASAQRGLAAVEQRRKND